MIKQHSVLLFFSGLVAACFSFALGYWVLARFHGGDGGFAEALFWSVPVAGTGYATFRSRAGWRGLLAWLTFLFCAMLLFQYWSLSMNDFFSIGSRVVYDQGFTSFGFLLLVYVPAAVVVLCGAAVWLAGVVVRVLSRPEQGK